MVDGGAGGVCVGAGWGVVVRWWERGDVCAAEEGWGGEWETVGGG